MKILELDLKKKMLIVDEINEKIAYGIIFQKYGVKKVNDYDFLCKGSELTEEIASELVEEHYMNGVRSYEIYTDYRYNDAIWLDSALDSFISAVESKGFHWLENPISNPNKIIQTSLSFKKFAKHSDLFYRFEAKTFKNPLIFIKNYVQ